MVPIIDFCTCRSQNWSAQDLKSKNKAIANDRNTASEVSSLVFKSIRAQGTLHHLLIYLLLFTCSEPFVTSSRCRNRSESSSAGVIKRNRLMSRLRQKYRFLCDSATFDQSSQFTSEHEQSQTQHHGSAMFTLWNLIADLVDSGDLLGHEQQQQQIVDFYAKAGTTFPRLACLMQLYLNATEILHRVSETVVFAEGDNNDLAIAENFVTRVEYLIKSDYYTYDKTYLPADEIGQAVIEPMIIVGKDAVVAAWKWYEHHLIIARKLFSIDHNFSSLSVTRSSLLSSRQKTLKQSIMLLDMNIFPLSAITDKHPTTGQT